MRHRIYSDNREDFALVRVPIDHDGDEMRKYLKRQELARECRLDFTGHLMQHEDGRVYEDVAIISTGTPETIACMAMAYHPELIVAFPCSICEGRGCHKCGHTGIVLGR